MTTEIRDEWLVEMARTGRVGRWEGKLMAQELIELREKLNLGQDTMRNVLPGDSKVADVDWANWVKNIRYNCYKQLGVQKEIKVTEAGNFIGFAIGAMNFRIYRVY